MLSGFHFPGYSSHHIPQSLFSPPASDRDATAPSSGHSVMRLVSCLPKDRHFTTAWAAFPEVGSFLSYKTRGVILALPHLRRS